MEMNAYLYHHPSHDETTNPLFSYFRPARDIGDQVLHPEHESAAEMRHLPQLDPVDRPGHELQPS